MLNLIIFSLKIAPFTHKNFKSIGAIENCKCIARAGRGCPEVAMDTQNLWQ